jgi:hypothetical protein
MPDDPGWARLRVFRKRFHPGGDNEYATLQFCISTSITSRLNSSGRTNERERALAWVTNSLEYDGVHDATRESAHTQR